MLTVRPLALLPGGWTQATTQAPWMRGRRHAAARVAAVLGDIWLVMLVGLIAQIGSFCGSPADGGALLQGPSLPPFDWPAVAAATAGQWRALFSGRARGACPATRAPVRVAGRAVR
jgi:hypothetical protein